MSLGQTASAPASTCETAVRAISSIDESLSISLAAEDAAVAVRGVLAEAHVGQQQQLGEARPQRAQRLLDDPVLDPRARALVVLLLGDAEEDHRVHAGAQQLLALAHDAVDRVPRERGQALVRQRLGRDEQRLHEVVERERRLAHEVAQRRRCGAAGEGAWSGRRSRRKRTRYAVERPSGASARSARSTGSTSTGIAPPPVHDSNTSRSPKNPHVALIAASIGSAISAPTRPFDLEADEQAEDHEQRVQPQRAAHHVRHHDVALDLVDRRGRAASTQMIEGGCTTIGVDADRDRAEPRPEVRQHLGQRHPGAEDERVVLGVRQQAGDAEDVDAEPGARADDQADSSACPRTYDASALSIRRSSGPSPGLRREAPVDHRFSRGMSSSM